MSSEFYISETFDSIQGEGNYTGALSFFLRLQYCNLTCSWCDSKYTWSKNEQIKAISAEEVKILIKASNSPNVILTGGEPTLYQLDKLVVADKKFHIETNGTLIPTKAIDINLPNGNRIQREAMNEQIIKHFNWVVSPKMKNAQQKLNEEALHFWSKKSWGIFKFVIQQKEDITEINELVSSFQLDKNRIYIALEGTSLESQLKPKLVDEIIAQGYNFSPRLHTMLWGNKRMK